MGEKVKPVARESSVDTKLCKNCSKCSLKTHRLIDVLIGRSIKSVKCQRLLETELLRRLQAGSCCPGNVFVEPVFDLEFSPDDKVMITGGKGSNISVFDPCIESKITTFDSKHFGFSRLIFLDLLTFATCSDDSHIALWDLRKLKESLMVLHGHTNPVKSMNYNSTTKQLISASFDDTVRLWNLDEYQTDGSVSSEIILTVPDLLRAELSQDFDKFFISTSNGLLLYFNNVDLNSLTKNYDEEFSKFDSSFFETPYRSRHYFSRTYFGNISKSKSLSNDRNKLWVLHDFPKDGLPSLISTVAISPNEKCVYTRYETEYSGEWSALHSIEGMYFISVSFLWLLLSREGRLSRLKDIIH